MQEDRYLFLSVLFLFLIERLYQISAKIMRFDRKGARFKKTGKI